MAYLQQSVAATQRESNRCTGQEICEITALKGLDHEIELIILTKKIIFLEFAAKLLSGSPFFPI
jgi:hypothetical protein